MNVKEFLIEHEKEFRFGSNMLIFIGATGIIVETILASYSLGEYIGAKKGIMAVRDPLMNYLNKDDYVKFCDHYDNFHNIKRG